jgi:hypothetical protein
MRALRCVLVLSLGVLAAAPLAKATIHEGFAWAGHWDFSDSVYSASDWDLTWVLTDPWDPAPCTPVSFEMNWPAVIMLSNVAYGDLLVAPTDPGLYTSVHCFVRDGVYVVKTREGHYTKIRTVDNFDLSTSIYYVHQDDGSPYFYDDHPLAVETTTWGRVKALFQAKP